MLKDFYPVSLCWALCGFDELTRRLITNGQMLPVEMATIILKKLVKLLVFCIVNRMLLWLNEWLA